MGNVLAMLKFCPILRILKLMLANFNKAIALFHVIFWVENDSTIHKDIFKMTYLKVEFQRLHKLADFLYRLYLQNPWYQRESVSLANANMPVIANQIASASHSCICALVVQC